MPRSHWAFHLFGSHSSGPKVGNLLENHVCGLLTTFSYTEPFEAGLQLARPHIAIFEGGTSRRVIPLVVGREDDAAVRVGLVA
jgi:hypothetical protein